MSMGISVYMEDWMGHLCPHGLWKLYSTLKMTYGIPCRLLCRSCNEGQLIETVCKEKCTQRSRYTLGLSGD
jgi:hypothetical protein